jgi:L-ascorbate metabolism protein UlaG (beta-lactamase superfamily)
MIEITWIGHASFQFKLDSGEVVLLDPWLEGNPMRPEGFEVAGADIILVSHGHSDHLGGVRPLAAKYSPLIVSNYEIACWLESKGVANTIGIGKGGTCEVGPLKVTMTHAIHSSSIVDDGKTLYGGEPAGFILHFPDGRRAYYSGDTGVMMDMKIIADLYSPELAILPVGSHYTMGPREAAYACRLLRPKKVIPMHYGTFPVLTGRPQQLAHELRDLPEIEILTLEPGKPVNW